MLGAHHPFVEDTSYKLPVGQVKVTEDEGGILVDINLSKDIEFIEEELVKDMEAAAMTIQPGERILQPKRCDDNAARDKELELIERGRAQAATMYPIVHDEGFREGWHACLNALFHTLRKKSATNRASKELLIELLDGS